MADNHLKTPAGRYLQAWAEGTILDQIQQTGRALPCVVDSVDGWTVVVNFQVQNAPFTFPKVRMPVAASRYLRPALQVGDPGVTMPSDAYLGGVSGLGGGSADLTQRANLAALVFVPIGNTSFAVPDASQTLVQGPGGVLVRDDAGSATVSVTTDSITLSAGGHTVVIGGGGVVIDGRVFLTHEHSGVQVGGGNTGGVV